jgi:hypothetical protein
VQKAKVNQFSLVVVGFSAAGRFETKWMFPLAAATPKRDIDANPPQYQDNSSAWEMP